MVTMAAVGYRDAGCEIKSSDFRCILSFVMLIKYRECFNIMFILTKYIQYYSELFSSTGDVLPDWLPW